MVAFDQQLIRREHGGVGFSPLLGVIAVPRLLLLLIALMPCQEGKITTSFGGFEVKATRALAEDCRRRPRGNY